MKYKIPADFDPSKPPRNEKDDYYYNLWLINRAHDYSRNTNIQKSSKGKQLSDKQKADRKRHFIIQALKNKDPIFNKIPTAKQHQSFFKNHQGSTHKKASAKTKHIGNADSDPDEGPAPKQAKFGGEDPNVVEKVMAAENDIPMGNNNDDDIMELSANGEHSRSGGGGGVGHSTTNWNCDTIWGSTTCTTYASRHCVCLMRDNDQYQLIGNVAKTMELGQENKTAWGGFSTPWNYIDFNQYCIHFSPRDWQHLCNNYSRWRPKSVHVKIGNIQVIQRTTTSETGTQYNNDLTGTIQIMVDQEGRYPRILYPSQTTMMGPFPNQVYYLPQYAYTTNIDESTNTNVPRMLTAETAFYCLDESPSEMLRTGNEWSSSYIFDENTRWVSNKYSTIPITERVNPLYDTWETNARGDDALRGNFGTWRSPWYPGPNLWLTDTTASGQTLATQPNVMVGPGGMPLNPGMPMYRPETDKDEFLHTFWIPKTVGMNEGDIRNAQIQASSAYKVQVMTNKLFNVNPRAVYYTADGEGTITKSNFSGMLPGMIWDNRPVTYFDPIWQQFPETDEQFKIVSQLGGIPMNKAPGHIFCKVTPKPTGTANQIIDEYATFTITIAIEWELEPMQTHRWNMRQLINYTTEDARNQRQMAQANGQYSLNADSATLNRIFTSKVIPRTN